jgi:predicted DNA-binding transcriptional regulator AlpA
LIELATMTESRPLYYPMMEQGAYPSVAAACTAVGWPADALDAYVASASIERSALVVTDIAIEHPGELLRVVLSFGDSSEVSLWVGFFGEMCTDRDSAMTFLAEMRELQASENAGWTGRYAVGEWPTRQRLSN